MIALAADTPCPPARATKKTWLHYRPPPGDLSGANSRPARSIFFCRSPRGCGGRFFTLAAKCALGRAAFESPRYAAVAVVSGLTTSPVERGGRPRGLSPMAMFSIAVVDRGFKRLPLCGATILPFLDFLAQPLDFGRGH